jgi:hypothetical protein
VQYLVTGSRATLLSLCASDRSPSGTVLSLIYRSRDPLVTLCVLDRSWRDAHFDIACATLSSLCACCIVSLWCGAHLTSFSRPSRHYVHVGSLSLWGALRCFTQVLLRNRFYTQKAFTRRIFLRARAFTQKLLHTGAFTHRSFDA